ncbi:MAG: DUF2341 domain-containing protein, partial [Candidatus Atribacteria bacterium]|nr:DUF2341 domain-containing protein [Candidatus Atribacteria bacterium]MCD6349399.1 DUF2341 domain-containing protein [Candidatus Atribacteria bacterium]
MKGWKGLKPAHGFDWHKQKLPRKTQIFHFLNPLHQHLCSRSRWYRLWHEIKDISFVHLGILIFASVFLLGYLLPPILPSLKLLQQKGKVLGASWYDYSWAYRDTITIDNTNKPNTLTDYQVLLDEGEVGYWKFDEGSGSTASDSSGLGNDGTINGASWTEGKYGQALSFDGSGDYVEAPAISDERTISLWLDAEASEQMVFFDGGITDQLGKAFQLGIYRPNGLGGNSTFDTGFGLYVVFWGCDIAVPFNSIVSGWHHIVVSWDGETTVRVSIDGQFPEGYVWDDPSSTWTFSQQPFVLPRIPTPDPSSTTLIGIGRKAMWGIGSVYFAGKLDEVRVYNRALSVEEMLYLYQHNRSPLLGDIYQYTQEDGDDLRFTDSDGTTLLSHWTELYTAEGQNAKIWIKVPEIPASSTKDIYIYFGNASTTSTSSGENTFDFFDDFENETKFNEGSLSVSFMTGDVKHGSYALYASGGGVKERKTIAQNSGRDKIFECWMKLMPSAATTSLSGIVIGAQVSETAGYQAVLDQRNGTVSSQAPQQIRKNWDPDLVLGAAYSDVSENTWYFLRLVWTSADVMKFYVYYG